MKSQPRYSILEIDPQVYHDNVCCMAAYQIDLKKRRSGTGDLPRCEECDRLEREASEIRGSKAFEQEYRRTGK